MSSTGNATIHTAETHRGTGDLPVEADAVVVGGGHNGLVAAGFLARAGLRPVVLEARADVGGAAITETPWGPDFRVTALSYVMSLMPDAIVTGLDLPRFGYEIEPLGPSYHPQLDGRALLIDEERPARYDAVARFSKRDAEALRRWDTWMEGIADVLGPLLTQVPPNVGSLRPGDLVDQLRTVWRLKGLGVRSTSDVIRLFTMSAADLLREWFETDAMQAAMAVNGIIGTWAGPEAPGTAYVLLHHSIGDVGDGEVGEWGFPRGGMGGVSESIRRAATALGARVYTEAPVERVLVRNGAVCGVALVDGREIRTDTVITAVHPRIGFLRHIEPGHLPDDFVRDIERWRSRSGTVKVNVAMDALPSFLADPGHEQQALHTGAIDLSFSIDHLEQAFQDARTGRASEVPFADCVIPSTWDRTICPDGTHIMSMFTQWVPATWADDPDDAGLEDYADRVVDTFDQVAPGFKRSILHRQVIGPYEMEHEYGLIGGNIFHGELSPDQLFSNRPAPGYADYRSPIAGMYQAHSATHAGGGVTGIPGWQASRAALADRASAERRAKLLRRKR